MMSFDIELINRDREIKQYTRYISQYNVLPAMLLTVSVRMYGGGEGFFVMHENLGIFIYVWKLEYDALCDNRQWSKGISKEKAIIQPSSTKFPLGTGEWKFGTYLVII